MGGYLHLLCRDAELGAEQEERLRAAGYTVGTIGPGPELLKVLSANAPRAVVIDLSRAPSTGRDIALAIRKRKSTSGIPLVFVGGDVAVIDGVRRLLADAVFTTWASLEADLVRAMAAPQTASPPSVLAGYKGVPLARKLGLRPNTTVATIGEPENFRDLLGEAADGVTFRTRPGGCDLAIWFVRSAEELEREMEWISAGAKSMWIAWPKGSGQLGLATVRASAFAAGLVDYKICSIDETWSALLFTRRVKPEPSSPRARPRRSAASGVRRSDT